MPRELVTALRRMAKATSEGRVVTMLFGGDNSAPNMSSQDVADLLNVSRPHVVKLARQGVLPYHKVGNRHRFAQEDVLAYQQVAARESDQELRSLTPAHGYGPNDL